MNENDEKMHVTYQRNVNHCSKSPYIKLYTISQVLPANNSDSLDIVRFKETDYQAVVIRGIYSIDDRVMFIPPESVIPFELSESLGITKYLSKGKVQISKLRGNRSEGLIVDPKIINPFLDHIFQWEDLPTVQMMGDVFPSKEIPTIFEKFFKMPNLRNEPQLFQSGEPIVWSEKIHGTNTRFGFLKNPETNNYQLYVGSHNIVLKESNKNLYWITINKIINEKLKNPLPKDIVYYGEIYGSGIQDMHYNTKNPSIKIFAVKEHGEYLPHNLVKQYTDIIGFESINFHVEDFENIEHIKEIAETPSEYYPGHREGVVIVSQKDTNKMAKVISETYLTRKNKTERH